MREQADQFMIDPQIYWTSAVIANESWRMQKKSCKEKFKYLSKHFDGEINHKTMQNKHVQHA